MPRGHYVRKQKTQADPPINTAEQDFNLQRIAYMLRALEFERGSLETLIMATPTGVCREHLTEANILLMIAAEKLAAAGNTLVNQGARGKP